MGLASKLHSAGAGGAMPPMPGGAPAGYGPSAPPAPTGYPSPYGQPGGAPGGAPTAGQTPSNPYGAALGAGPQPSVGAPGQSPYPSPYPGASAPPSASLGQQQSQQIRAAPSPYPSPYPGAAPQQSAGAGGYPSPYPGSAPPGAQQATGAPGYPSPYPGAPSGGQGMPAGMQQQSGYPTGMPGSAPPMGASGTQQQMQQPMMAGGAPGGMASAILTKFNQIVAVNQLQRFYNPQSLQALASRLDSRVNFRDLAARWRMPVELALDLSSLALYDIILFADDSGSMAFEENGERIDDLKLIGNKLSEVATMFDDDGILVRFMNSNVQGNSVRSAADVGNLLASVQYTGLTPLASSMQSKVLQPIVYNLASSGQLQKPVLIMTITDGEPTDTPKDLIVQVIKEARGRLAPQYGPKAVAFEFAQVGKDQRAQAFLGHLDTHPEVGSSIDCTSYFELESSEYQKRGIQLSPEMWLVKMMVGSIDPSYDEGDEQRC